MSNSLSIHYDHFTEELEDYVRDCVATAANSSWGYKKKEAAMRADGAIRVWMKLFAVEAMKVGTDADQRFQADLVRLRQMVQAIPVDDE
ncbi:hypothetical protein CIW54_22785 [Paraburkholderia sp. T12-10]|nr:hypothetical protein CIW54_22785 [Paraburkholderia sp. T12-10]